MTSLTEGFILFVLLLLMLTSDYWSPLTVTVEPLSICHDDDLKGSDYVMML